LYQFFNSKEIFANQDLRTEITNEVNNLKKEVILKPATEKNNVRVQTEIAEKYGITLLKIFYSSLVRKSVTRAI